MNAPDAGQESAIEIHLGDVGDIELAKPERGRAKVTLYRPHRRFSVVLRMETEDADTARQLAVMLLSGAERLAPKGWRIEVPEDCTVGVPREAVRSLSDMRKKILARETSGE